MKILHIANVRDRPQSGVAVVVPKHVKHQSAHAEVALLNLDGFTPEGATDTYRLYRFRKGLRISDLPDGFSNPDLVVFHEVYWAPFIALAKELRRRSIPYVIVPHVSLTDVAQRSKKVKKMIGNVLFFNRFVDGAEAIQYLSESEKVQTSKFSHKTSIVRSNAIDFRGRLKKKFSTNGLRFIYVGRFAFHVKGIDRILDTAAVLKEKGVTDVHITLVGADHDGGRGKIDAIIKDRSLDSMVTVKDGLFGDDKVAEILKNDCFLQLSRTEGQPLSIMEAMEIGMPCVVTAGTTFREVVSDNRAGIAVSDDPVQIAKAILQINNDKLKQFSVNASNYIHAHYDWNIVSLETVRDYEAIVAASKK